MEIKLKYVGIASLVMTIIINASLVLSGSIGAFGANSYEVEQELRDYEGDLNFDDMKYLTLLNMEYTDVQHTEQQSFIKSQFNSMMSFVVAMFDLIALTLSIALIVHPANKK